MEISGLDAVLKNLKRIRTRLPLELEVALDAVGQDMVREAKSRTSYPYQTVPSYLGKKGKKFPKGTVPFFAKGSPSIAGSPWEGRVQKYPKGNHPLSDLIQHETAVTNNTVTVAVGYPDGIGEGSTSYIIKVLFGSTKMQPRNYLGVLLNDYKTIFLSAVRQAGRRAFGLGLE